jgi:hypothetical protein
LNLRKEGCEPLAARLGLEQLDRLAPFQGVAGLAGDNEVLQVFGPAEGTRVNMINRDLTFRDSLLTVKQSPPWVSCASRSAFSALRSDAGDPATWYNGVPLPSNRMKAIMP